MDENAVVKAYKGFDKNLKCRGFQYEIGKEYEMEGPVKACQSGFHACEAPMDVLAYYAPATSRYCEVEQSGKTDRDGKDTKVASSKIKIGAEIGIPGLVKAQIEWAKENAKKTTSSETANAATSGSRANAATSGYGANAATSGYGANAATSGDGANAATSGSRANAATSGDWANAATSGDGAVSVCSGEDSSAKSSGLGGLAVGWGKGNKASGEIGTFIVLCERGDWNGKEYPVVNAKMIRIDGDTYKPDTWYTLKNGEIVEAE